MICRLIQLLSVTFIFVLDFRGGKVCAEHDFECQSAGSEEKLGHADAV